jgi:DNA primase
MDAYAKLREMFPIEDVIGDYLPIEPGWGYIEADPILDAECPFHDNGDRAKTVEIDRKAGEFRCTGCDAMGDAIDFISQYERISRYGAALMLCRRIEDVNVRRPIVKAFMSDNK